MSKDEDEDQDDSNDNDSSDDNTNEDSNDDNSDTSLSADHQTAIGNGLVEAAQARGIDVATLAQQIGLSTDDVSEFTQGDYLKAAEHLAKEHPDIVENITDRIPVVGGFLRNFLGGN